MAASQDDFLAAHKHSSRHRAEIMASARCGCFYCMASYPPADIIDWIDEDGGIGMTALCPRCGMDSVIGSASGFPITETFLRALNYYWFLQTR
jgi:hypothetical protein